MPYLYIIIINRTTMAKNTQGKTRPVDLPYEIWQQGEWEWRVLKKYQSPENEAKNPYARWYCAVKSSYTHGSWEYGDTYVKDVTTNARKTYDETTDPVAKDLFNL